MIGPIPVPRRVYVTLPDTVADDLQRWADIRGQAIATTGAIAIELKMEDLKREGVLPDGKADSTSSASDRIKG